MPRILSREPWPANPIESYRCIDDGPWGYLVVMEGGHVQFITEVTPPREAIEARWGTRLKLDPGADPAPMGVSAGAPDQVASPTR